MFALSYELGGGLVDAGDLLLASGVASTVMLLVGGLRPVVWWDQSRRAHMADDKAAPAHRRSDNLESKL